MFFKHPRSILQLFLYVYEIEFFLSYDFIPETVRFYEKNHSQLLIFSLL